MSHYDDTLEEELNTDPLKLGYDEWAGDPPTEAEYQSLADKLNKKVRTREVDSSSSALFLAIKPADFQEVYTTGSLGEQRYLDTLLALPEVPLKNPSVRTALTGIFDGKADTLEALETLQKKKISRAVELGFRKVKVGDLRRIKGDLGDDEE